MLKGRVNIACGTPSRYLISDFLILVFFGFVSLFLLPLLSVFSACKRINSCATYSYAFSIYKMIIVHQLMILGIWGTTLYPTISSRYWCGNQTWIEIIIIFWYAGKFIQFDFKLNKWKSMLLFLLLFCFFSLRSYLLLEHIIITIMKYRYLFYQPVFILRKSFFYM